MLQPRFQEIGKTAAVLFWLNSIGDDDLVWTACIVGDVGQNHGFLRACRPVDPGAGMLEVAFVDVSARRPVIDDQNADAVERRPGSRKNAC